MKLLIFEWAAGTFTYDDIIASFTAKGVTYRTVSYQFNDKNEDEFFIKRFTKVLKDDTYDAVFSVNYFPLVAVCCHDCSLPYISWSYDNPLDVPDIEKTLGLPGNFVFLFDRIQTEGYRRMGFSNVYHMPLAVNCERLETIKLTKQEQAMYAADVSFVGKMYDSMFPQYRELMDDHCKGYIDAIVAAQSKVFGYWFAEELLTDDLMKRINDHFKVLSPDTQFALPREALAYAIAAQITKTDRLILLNLLAKRMNVNVYSWEKCDLLQNVKFMGSYDYYGQMTKVFKASSINLNITLKISQSGIPLRVMDILGAGGFLLSNYQTEIAENFINGEDVVMYESIEDAFEKALFYKEHDDLRRQIAQSGHSKAKELFSYEKQLGKIFDISGMTV
ncbi:MAG: glycosyltransferase [Lachnospiraceae bacterium]|nr:glycosyltransferase [Lachnospiraceae bacterium]